MIYEEVWKKLYSKETGYENRLIGRWLKKYARMPYEEVVLDMLDQQKKRKKNMVGTEKDLKFNYGKRSTCRKGGINMLILMREED